MARKHGARRWGARSAKSVGRGAERSSQSGERRGRLRTLCRAHRQGCGRRRSVARVAFGRACGSSARPEAEQSRRGHREAGLSAIRSQRTRTGLQQTAVCCMGVPRRAVAVRLLGCDTRSGSAAAQQARDGDCTAQRDGVWLVWRLKPQRSTRERGTRAWGRHGAGRSASGGTCARRVHIAPSPTAPGGRGRPPDGLRRGACPGGGGHPATGVFRGCCRCSRADGVM